MIMLQATVGWHQFLPYVPLIFVIEFRSPGLLMRWLLWSQVYLQPVPTIFGATLPQVVPGLVGCS